MKVNPYSRLNLEFSANNSIINIADPDGKKTSINLTIGEEDGRNNDK
jgi:hypothetical protein